MHENMNTFSLNDAKTEEKWSEYKLMIENIHNVTSYMKKQKDKQKITMNRKRGVQWLSKSSTYMRCRVKGNHSDTVELRNKAVTYFFIMIINQYCNILYLTRIKI